MKRFARWILAVLLSFLLWPALVAAQPAYPSKPIRLISPYPPGGATTVMARLISQRLTERWGQPVIIDNRPGGNAVIGTEAAVKSTPDGYTILVGGNSLIITPLLVSNLPYDSFKDLAPVAMLASAEFMLVLNPSVPANNLQELIALARSKPGQLNYGTSGTGTIAHLMSELININAGIKMQHIPYKGGAQIVTDLMGGQLQLAVQPAIFAIAQIKAGKLKAVAIGGEMRLAALPQVPTFREAGLAGIDVNAWWGLLAPAGTPKAIVDKLSAEVASILALPDTKEKAAAQGLDPFITTAEQMAAQMKLDSTKYARIIKAANIKLDD
jgi:tripartite-type tricarboxylate transporter receptor subunit TctC